MDKVSMNCFYFFLQNPAIPSHSQPCAGSGFSSVAAAGGSAGCFPAPGKRFQDSSGMLKGEKD